MNTIYEQLIAGSKIGDRYILMHYFFLYLNLISADLWKVM